MKKSKLVYCEKCGVIKSKKTKCSNCIDIHRLSQGMSRLGERKIEEDKERQRNISKGRIMSNKKKKKKKNKFKGKRTLEFREQGEKESRAQYYNKYIKSPNWFVKRELILEEDNKECVVCEGEANIVHHWKYNQVLGTEPDHYLSSLCERCHNFIHDELEDSLKKAMYSKGKTFKKRKQKVIDTAYVMISDEVLDQECFNIVNN